MYANDYSVRVPEGNETPGGYVELEHNTQYTLVLRNNRDVRCDARVEVDGKPVGVFRINAHSNLRLERPAHDDGKFTFYKTGTKEASDADLDERDPNLGLIKVTFTPEQKGRSYWYWTPMPTYNTHTIDWTYNDSSVTAESNAYQTRNVCDSYSPGGTGLSGKSDQNFVETSRLNYDYSQQTVIHLRLVARDAKRARPLTSYSTPVPPPVR